MGLLDPLLMYMAFSLLNSATEWILRSLFTPIERGAEADPRGPKSMVAGRKPAGIGR
jgi:hypothetical protein